MAKTFEENEKKPSPNSDYYLKNFQCKSQSFHFKKSIKIIPTKILFSIDRINKSMIVFSICVEFSVTIWVDFPKNVYDAFDL